MISRRSILLAIGALPALALAQSATPRRIAMLMSASLDSYRNLLHEFKVAMNTLGYVEGRDIVYDIRWAENKLERLPALITELIALKPAAIVTHGSPGVVACQAATSTVPIVFASAGDPVGQGFVQSFRRPGGNITGVAFNDEINKKVYELVKDLMPRVKRIAVLANVKNPGQKHHLDVVPMMARQLGFQSIVVNATQETELESAFKDASRHKAQALVAPPLAPFVGSTPQLVQLQNKFRLPVFFGLRTGPKAGGVASYSFPLEENFRRSAAILDKILKGQNPAEIPVEIPIQYEVVLNLKAAKALGITVPKMFLARVNKVIE